MAILLIRIIAVGILVYCWYGDEPIAGYDQC